MIAMQRGLLPFRIPVVILSTLGRAPLFSLAILGKITGYHFTLDDVLRQISLRGVSPMLIAAAVLMIPLAAVIGELVLASLSHGGTPGILRVGPDSMKWWLILIIPLQLAAALFTSPLLEEPGWRRFALVELQRTLPPVVSSFIVGSYWWLWHQGMNLAFDLRPSLYGYLTMLALSFTIDSLFNLSGGSLMVAMLAHQASGTAITFLNSTPNNPYTLGLMTVAAAVLRLSGK
jgi:membrane protease YdiL (CAAX protease family)